MNEEQVQARMAEMDAALENVPGEHRGAVYEVFGKLLGEHAGALSKLDASEEEAKKATAPAPLTREAIMAIKDGSKRVRLIADNPQLFGPNAERPVIAYSSREEIMAIKNVTERLNQITANPELFKPDSFTTSIHNEVKPQFQ